MRVWDISPGYLNKDSLLGEHREIHALLAVLRRGKAGYANHPETSRWRGREAALGLRHQMVAAEMFLRGYVDHTPVNPPGQGHPKGAAAAEHPVWPEDFLDYPAEQFRLLESRYLDWGRGGGRIPFPRSRQELWAQHKYSVMARNPEEYRRLGRAVSGPAGPGDLDDLAIDLVRHLRSTPSWGGIRNAAAHVWGYVSGFADAGRRAAVPALLDAEPLEVLALSFRLATEHEVTYLLHSTVFSDLPGHFAGGHGSAAGDRSTRKVDG